VNGDIVLYTKNGLTLLGSNPKTITRSFKIKRLEQ